MRLTCFDRCGMENARTRSQRRMLHLFQPSNIINDTITFILRQQNAKTACGTLREHHQQATASNMEGGRKATVQVQGTCGGQTHARPLPGGVVACARHAPRGAHGEGSRPSHPPLRILAPREERLIRVELYSGGNATGCSSHEDFREDRRRRDHRRQRGSEAQQVRYHHRAWLRVRAGARVCARARARICARARLGIVLRG